MTNPNATLRAVRMGLLMSQDDFARAIRAAGRRAGVTGKDHGGHDLEEVTGGGSKPNGMAASQPAPPAGNYTGVWLSRYEYFSSGRDETYSDVHYVVILQHGSRLTVRSLPASANSQLTMDLTVDGNVITGTWVEQTAEAGYYRGARYHGAIQVLVEPTGRRMSGKWVGFGKEMDVNSGPWELIFQDASTNRATMDRYNRRP